MMIDQFHGRDRAEGRVWRLPGSEFRRRDARAAAASRFSALAETKRPRPFLPGGKGLFSPEPSSIGMDTLALWIVECCSTRSRIAARRTRMISLEGVTRARTISRLRRLPPRGSSGGRRNLSGWVDYEFLTNNELLRRISFFFLGQSRFLAAWTNRLDFSVAREFVQFNGKLRMFACQKCGRFDRMGCLSMYKKGGKRLAVREWKVC